MLNSLLLGVVTSVSAMAIGTSMAWLVSQTDIPLRRVIRVCILGNFAVPAFVNALSWVLLAGPNAGLLNTMWMSLTGSETGFINIFSMHGLILVSTCAVYSLAFIFMYNAFESIDSDMEQAARILGASGRRVFFTVTLPLATPAIIAGFIMTFLESLTLYGAPAVIGVPARIYVVTTQVWALFEYPPQVAVAAALSLPLVIITVALLWVQKLALGRRTFGTIQGKAGRRQRYHLGAWRWPIFAYAAAVVILTFILPNAMLLAKSIYQHKEGLLSLSNLTLGHYRYVVFDYIDGIPSIKNSLITSFIAASAAIVLALVAAFIAERRLISLSGLIGFLATLPLVVPSMVFAVGLVAAYSKSWISLYGTLTILVLAYLTKNLPYAYMTCGTALSTVHVDLEHAARVFGASNLRVLRQITAPLIRGGILTGWIVVFANSLRELSSSVLLYTSKTTVIPTAIMDVYYASDWGSVAALSVILLAINATVIGAGYGLFGRNAVNPNA
jgi:iron(III) transport system permease protein